MAKVIDFAKKNYVISIILILAVFARLYKIGIMPAGMHPDEAYGAYNAYSLLHEGIDSRGYAFPLYFVAWGSGMSVLYSYLAVPLFWLFGTADWVYRIPQAVIGIAAVYAVYRTSKEMYNTQFALLVSFMLAVNPWHVINNRYGLDANMAPSMMMIAICFLTLGLKKNGKYLIPAAVTFGLTLYCYALSWIILPPVLLLTAIVFWKDIKKDKYLVIFCTILFSMALPLLLFVAINLGMIPEMQTRVFSIPKLYGFRGSELSFGNIINSIKRLTEVVLGQYDGIPYTSSELVGAYYYFTTPFLVIGIAAPIFDVITTIKNKKCGHKQSPWYLLMFFWLICAGISFALNEYITMIHINMIHIPVIFYGAYGIYRIAEMVRSKAVVPLCTAFVLLSFCLFYKSYMTTDTGYTFGEEAYEAIEEAKQRAGEDGTVTIVGYATIKYSNLLWYEKVSAKDLVQKAIYTGDSSWEELQSYGRYEYVEGIEDVNKKGAYIILNDNMQPLYEMGYMVESINASYAVAWK